MNTKSKIAASAVSLLTVLGAGAYGTFSAFTDTEQNIGNTFAAGTLNIADNDAQTAMFKIENVKPGDSATRCVNVTNTGSLASDGLAITEVTSGGTTDLRPALGVVVEALPASPSMAFGESAACAAANATSQLTSTSSLGSLNVPDDTASFAPQAVKTYRFKVTFREQGATIDNTYQGGTAAFSVKWDAKSFAGQDRANDVANPAQPADVSAR
jgi:predicted ribosomally synthesized peptide with SipW-like signal peptide